MLPGGRTVPVRTPLPIDPGRWGRPAAAPVDTSSEPAWVPLGAPPPPPPPRLPATVPFSAGSGFSSKAGNWLRTRGRRRSALIEGGVAIAILLALGLTGELSGAGPAQVGSTALANWAQTAGPALTNLLDDVGTIDAATRPNAGVTSEQLRAEAVRYQQDLGTATRLEPAPDRTMAQLWTTTLLQLAPATQDLNAARPSDPAATARAHVRFAAAQEELLQLEQDLASRA